MSKFGTKPRTKYSSTKCDKDLKSGFLCLCMCGVLSVAHQAEKAVLRKFYFCPMKTCIPANSPWTNIKLPAHITRDKSVSKSEFDRIAARNLS